MAISERDNVPDCTCGVLSRLADDARSLVRFDPITNSYCVMSRDGQWLTPIRYCFHCGGRAPNRSNVLFENITPDEREDVMAIAKQCKHIADVMRILGDPDKIVTSEEIGLPSFEPVLFTKTFAVS